MKTIKLIDLLVDIANGEELPPKIQFRGMIWVLESDLGYCEDYYSKDLGVYLFHNKWALTNNLNDEVEIIEEDKKIEHVNKTYDLTDFMKDYPEVAMAIRDIGNKQYEIIDKLNEMSDKE